MNINAKAQVTLADIERVTLSNTSMPPERRRRMIGALRAVYRYSGRHLEAVPATMSAVREIFSKINPAAVGVQRPALHNTRNLVMHAMTRSGQVPELASYRKPQPRLSPCWAAVRARIPSQSIRWSLEPFIHYANKEGIAPSEAGDQTCAAFCEHRMATSFRSTLEKGLRQAKRDWNRFRVAAPDLGLPEVTLDPSRLRVLPVKRTEFPPSFREDVDRYIEWCGGKDIFAENARPRALSPTTIATYERKIHRSACFLAAEIGTARINSLRTLVEIANFKTLLRGVKANDHSEQQNETFQTAVLLISLARDWLSLDQPHIKELEELRKRLKKPEMKMTEKNKKLVSEFDDPEVLKRLIETPAKLWARVQKDKRTTRSPLATAQAAISISILTAMPIRLANLASLKFDRNIILRPNGTSSLIIRAEDTKAGRDIEFDIPPHISNMLHEYRFVIAPRIVGAIPEWLFCRTDGVNKGMAQVRYLVQAYFKEYVGFHMNPHAFRHLAAKMILDANPGGHVLVQELLGHKSVETAIAFYAGLNSRRAGRHHHQLLVETLARASVSSNRKARQGRGR